MTSGIGRFDVTMEVTCPECEWTGDADVRFDADRPFDPGYWDCPACKRTDNEEEPDGYDD